MANDIALFLDKFAPRKLADLERRHPDGATILRADGLTLGPEETGLAVDSAKVMLSSVSDVAMDAVGQTGRTLRSASRLDLIGGLLATGATGAAVVSVLGKESVYASAVLAFIGFVASGAPLVARWLRGGVSGGEIAKTFIELRELAWDAGALCAEIERLGPNDEARLKDAIARANTLAKSAYVALSEVGYQPSFRPV